MQKQLIAENPYHLPQMLEGIQSLIAHFRETNHPIIFVRHNDLGMPLGSLDWEIDSSIAPMDGERLVDKSYNSAFKDTNLKTYLDELEITTVIVVGMQIEYCIDATIKSAFDLGYHVIVPKGLVSTFDNNLMSADTLIKHYEGIWAGRFAQLQHINEMIK
ncbi:Isochorismatase [Streptococcus uberis]|nr:Isochorismatase [Streptococcus uberis]